MRNPDWMNVSMRTGLALAIGFSIATVVGCRDEGPASSAGTRPASDRADPTNVTQPMNSLKVADPASRTGGAATSAASVTQSTNGAANRQSLTTRAASGPFAQRQDGSGNTQVLNVEGASSAGVAQRQSGSGNYQSMNIGVTDNPSNPGTSAGSRP